MRDMSVEERRAFMMGGHKTGKLASVRADGRPHVTPIWFVIDGDDVIFSVYHDTVKLANLRHDPRVAFCVDDDNPPFSYVIVEGTVTFDAHAPDLMAWEIKLGTRYMGAELGESFGKRNAVEGEYLVRLKPTKIIAKAGIAD
jgi:PPOX class probable F420-dependent enzyme